MISNSIGSDWVKLYYALPFYPTRGKETIKKDIEDVLSNLNRGNMERVIFLFILKYKSSDYIVDFNFDVCML